MLAFAISALLAHSFVRGATLGGFEIDADSGMPAALYSASGRDWATGSGQGVFKLGAGGVTGCYDSNITHNAASGGAAWLLCDGSSDSKFDGNGGDTITEPERNIVGPGGKQTNDAWPVKSGGVPAKDDFSHAYAFFWQDDSSCDTDTIADDAFIALGGHRGDNEGDAFWGFELNDIAPTGFPTLASNAGTTFNLDFNRRPGDLLVSTTLTGGGTNPLLEIFRWSGTTYALAPSLCPANPGAPQGDSLLRTNPAGDVTAPPWNVPVCDPTATNASNTCRIVNGAGVGPAAPGDNRIAPRDFVESVIDVGAFGVGDVCFSSLVFTSRSAHPLSTADLKDVGGIAVNTCVPPAPPPPAVPPPAAPPGAPPLAPPHSPPEGDPPGLPPRALPPTGGQPTSEANYAWATVLVVSSAAVPSLFFLRQMRRR